MSYSFKGGIHPPPLPEKPHASHPVEFDPEQVLCTSSAHLGCRWKLKSPLLSLSVTAGDQKVLKETGQALTGGKSQFFVKKFPA